MKKHVSSSVPALAGMYREPFLTASQNDPEYSGGIVSRSESAGGSHREANLPRQSMENDFTRFSIRFFMLKNHSKRQTSLTFRL
jgi:hypothetical protein